MLTGEQRARLQHCLDHHNRNGSMCQTHIAIPISDLRSILASAAPADEGRETSAPTCNIAVDLTRELVRSAWVKRFNYVYDRMVEDSELMGFARAIQLECFKTIATAPTKPADGRGVKAYLYQHKQSGKTTFVTPELSRDEFEGMNPEYAYVGALVLATAPTMSEAARDVLWRHKKTGGVYSFVAESRMERDPKAVVVTYRNIKTGETWTRSYGEFYDGRFERIDRAAAKGGSDEQ